MKFRYWFLGLSATLILIGVVFIVTQGFKVSVDFTGGSVLELRAPAATTPLNLDDANSTLGETFSVISVQTTGQNQWVLKGSTLDNQQKQIAIEKLQTKLGAVEELRYENVGPTLGKELITKTVVAVLLVSVLITAYVAYQFQELKYGVSAVLAMFHDTLILIGSFSVLGWMWGVEVDVLFVTALLTTLSFSVHDTIVVYDRIRELRRQNPRTPYLTLVDTAVIQTLGRSLNNSLTIILMLLALVLLGGDTIRWFAVALLIGAITGTYSSTFVAAPLLLLWEEIKARRASR